MFGRVPDTAAKVDFMRSCLLLFPELGPPGPAPAWSNEGVTNDGFTGWYV